MVNYVLSDFFASLNVARLSHMRRVQLSYTPSILIILKKLQDLGLIGRYKVLDKKKVEIFIKYSGIGSKCAFNNIVTVSRPGKRVHLDMVKFEKFKWRSYADIYLVYTRVGLLTNFECFLSNISGEVICKIEL